MRLDIRGTYLFGCIVSIIAIVSFLYLRVIMLDIFPCPLCIFEFSFLVLSGICLLVLTWFFPSESVHTVMSVMALVFNFVGLVLSVRHLMLLKIVDLNTICYHSQAEINRDFSPSRLVGTFVEAFRAGVCQGGIDALGVNVSVWLLICFAVSLVFMMFQMSRVKKYGMLG